MKLLTINTHSLIEVNYTQKLEEFIRAVEIEKPDIIAMQEVNQTADKKVVCNAERYFACDKTAVIREDNHVYSVSRSLKEYYWTWLPIKKGYDKFDEGIALMSRSPIVKTDVITVSNITDYSNWKTRKLLGISVSDYPNDMFFSVHYGWWNDCEEPFESQWNKTVSHMKKYDTVWLMGDFNNPAEIRNEGYDMIMKSNWYDSTSENYTTASTKIDGWNDKHENKIRIDFILCNKPRKFLSSKPIFDDKEYFVISDHFGVISEVETK